MCYKEKHALLQCFIDKLRKFIDKTYVPENDLHLAQDVAEDNQSVLVATKNSFKRRSETRCQMTRFPLEINVNVQIP